MHTLKKYPNRRIYDPEQSKYITLADVRDMVIAGDVFQVVDSKSGEDLTRSVLLQIIAEIENEGHESLLTNRVLEELIRFYGNKMSGMLGPFIEQQILGFLQHQDQLKEQLKKLSSGVMPNFQDSSINPFQSMGVFPTPDQFMDQMVRQYQQMLQQFGNAAQPKSSAAQPKSGGKENEDEGGKASG